MRLFFEKSGDVAPWIAGYEKYETFELHHMVDELRFVTQSLKNEIAHRAGNNRDGPKPHDLQRLHKTVATYSMKWQPTFVEWLSLDSHAQYSHAQSAKLGVILKSYVEGVVVTPRPAVGRGTNIQALVLIVFNYIGLPHALLFLYAMPYSIIKELTVSKMIDVVLYIKRNAGSLMCDFFRNEASKISADTAVLPSRNLTFSSLPFESQLIIAMIVSFGGKNVPDLIFKRFLDRQQRWSANGDITVAEPGWIKMEPGLTFTRMMISLFGNEPQKTEAIKMLSSSWIYVKDPEDPLRVKYSLQDNVKDQVLQQWSDEDRVRWYTIALQLICHVFPRDPAWEESFQTHGSLLAPCLDHIMGLFEDSRLPLPLREALAEALVAKARLGKRYLSTEALRDATMLLGRTISVYMQAVIDLQVSNTLRLEGKFAESQRAIEHYTDIDSFQPIHEARFGAVFTLIIISYLENLLQLRQYQAAFIKTRLLMDLDQCQGEKRKLPSEMQLRVALKKALVLSKIHHAVDKPNEALSLLLGVQNVIDAPQLKGDMTRYQVICLISDLLCASDCPHCIAEARQRICKEISRISKSSQKLSKALRRLKVSMLEVDLAEGRYSDAYAAAQLLKDLFRQMQSPDLSDQWLFARSVSVAARAAFHLDGLDNYVKEWALFVQSMDNRETESRCVGFLSWVGQLSMLLARPSLPTSWDSLQIGDRGCQSDNFESPNYYIAPITTTWLSFVLSRTKSMLEYRRLFLNYSHLQQLQSSAPRLNCYAKDEPNIRPFHET